MKFSTEDFSGFQESADLVTFTEEIHNGKLQFLCSIRHREKHRKEFEKRRLQLGERVRISF